MRQAENGGTQLAPDALTKYSAVAGLVAYATGMLTINVYLHQLGITDFSLAKPKLVLTGLVVLLTFLLLALFPNFVARRIWSRGALGGQPLPPSAGMMSVLLLPLFGLIAASAFLCFKNPPGLGEISVWKIWELINTRHQTILISSLTALLVAAEIYFPICLAAIAAWTTARLFDRAKLETAASHSQMIPDHIYFPIALALTVISVILYIYIFSLTLYPAISPAFGGGKPYLERFVVADGTRCQWQQLGVPFTDEFSNATAPLPVLHESDTLVAVWLTEEGWKPIVVELDKNQISATRMVDPRAKKMPSVKSLPTRCTAK